MKHAVRFGAELVAVWTDDAERLASLAGRLAPDVAGEIVAAAELGDGPFPPTGVIALARRPAPRPFGPGHIVLLDHPRHLGNVGAAIRVAAAADAAGVVVTGEADPWHPQAVRGAAGLQFALPIGDGIPDDRPLVALDPEGAPLCPDAIPSNAVLAFGSERRGLSPEVLDRAERRVTLPMRPGVSSLNLATAVAATLYTLSAGRAVPGG